MKKNPWRFGPGKYWKWGLKESYFTSLKTTEDRVHNTHEPEQKSVLLAGLYWVLWDSFRYSSASSTVHIPAWRYRWRWSNCQRRLEAVETPEYNSLVVALRQPRFPYMSANSILLQQTLAPPGSGTFRSELSIPVRLRSLPQVFHQFHSKVAHPKWILGAGLWRTEVTAHLVRSGNNEQRGGHTVSLSMIPATPWTAAVSNVSIDVSRFVSKLSSSYQPS